MFLQDMKTNRFLLSCLVLFACLTTALAQETPQDAPKTDLDFNALLAAIKRHDALLKSGEGEIVYTLGELPFNTDIHSNPDTLIITGTIAFNAKNTRFDAEPTPFHSQGKTTILTPSGRWEIVPHKNRKPNYSFTKVWTIFRIIVRESRKRGILS